MGTTVVELRDSVGKTQSGHAQKMQKKTTVFGGTVSYLLMGGLDALGYAVSVWKTRHGARNFISLPRSSGRTRPEDQSFTNQLESMGCTVQLVRGTDTDPGHVGRAVGGILRP